MQLHKNQNRVLTGPWNGLHVVGRGSLLRKRNHCRDCRYCLDRRRLHRTANWECDNEIVGTSIPISIYLSILPIYLPIKSMFALSKVTCILYWDASYIIFLTLQSTQVDDNNEDPQVCRHSKVDVPCGVKTFGRFKRGALRKGERCSRRLWDGVQRSGLKFRRGVKLSSRVLQRRGKCSDLGLLRCTRVGCRWSGDIGKWLG